MIRRILNAATGRVGRTTAWSVVSVLLSTVIGMLTARLLGPNDRGLLALIVTLSGMMVLVSALGSNVAIRRLLPRSDEVSVRGYWSLTHSLLVVLLPLQVLVYLFLTRFAGMSPGWAVMSAFLSYGLCYFYSNQSVDLLYAHGLPSTATRTKTMGTLGTLLIIVVCFVAQLGLLAVVLAYALGSLVSVAVARRVVHRHTLVDGRPAVGQRVLARTGMKLLGMTLGQVLTSRIDTFFLGLLAVPSQVGFYAVAITPAALLRLPAAALGQVVMHDAASTRVNKRKVLKRTALIVVLSVPLAVIGALSADWLIPLVFGTAFSPAAGPFKVLLLAELCMLPFLVLSRFLAAVGSPGSASACGSVGVAVLTGSSFFLIPPLGAVGAAWASVAAYASMSVLAMVLTITGKSDSEARVV